MVDHAAIKTNVGAIMTTQMIRKSMPDSMVLKPVSGRNLSKATGKVHPTWTKSSRGLARFMAPPTSLPITPIEIARFLRRPVN